MSSVVVKTYFGLGYLDFLEVYYVLFIYELKRITREKLELIKFNKSSLMCILLVVTLSLSILKYTPHVLQ